MNNDFNNNNINNFNSPQQPINNINNTQFQPLQQPNYNQQPNFNEQPVYDQQPIKNKKHGKTILLIVIAIALVIALAFGIKFIMGHNKTVDKNIESTFDLNALIRIKKDDKYGYIDSNGKFVIQPQYTYATSFTGNYAMVSLETEVDGKKRDVYQLIDKAGTVKATADYSSDIKYFKDYDVWLINKQLYNGSLKKLSADGIKVDDADYGYFKWTNDNYTTGGIMNSSGKITYTYKFETGESYIHIDTHKKNKYVKNIYCTANVENMKYAIVNCDTGKVIYDYSDKYISSNGNNIFKISRKDTYEFISTLYIQDDEIVFQSSNKNVSLYYSDYGYIQITDDDKDYDQKYSYIDLSSGQIVTQKPANSTNLNMNLNEWEEYTSIKKFSCDTKYGLMSDDKVKIPCEWSYISYLDLPIYKYLSSKGKEYVIASKDNKSYLLNLKDGKTVAEFNDNYVYNVSGTTFIYYTENSDSDNKIVYNLVTGKSLSIESGTSLKIYSNYITFKKDGKLNYYNADLKLIYTE